jgi:hypothetical protein
VVFPFTGADAKRPLALEKFAYRINEHAEDKLKETIRSAVSAVPRLAFLKSFNSLFTRCRKCFGVEEGDLQHTIYM